jgi:hypothetical protein
VCTNTRGPRLSIKQTLVGAGALALALTAVPPVGQVSVTATPVTMSETLEGLPAAEDADAGEVGLATTDEPATAVSEVVEAPLTFSMLGFTAPDEAEAVRVRTRVAGGEWSAWEQPDFMDDDDGPDEGSNEEAEATEGQHTEPVWVGEGDELQLELDGAELADIKVEVIDSMGLSGGPVERSYDTELGNPADAHGVDIISRAGWGADESLGSSTVSTARQVHMGVVHHTAHTTGSRANTYSRAEAPGIMRAMHRYHTNALGWRDLGYNVVVDRFGNIYEGRKGGFENGVVGAHAAGFNSGSFGVSVMGDFTNQQAPAAAIEALTEVIAAKSAIHGIDPEGWTDRMRGTAWRPTILGHRDVGQTACPGRISSLLPRIRENASQQSVRFPDVDSSSPHRSAILRLADAGVTSGCVPNEFCPDQVLNRGQAATFVKNGLELPTERGNDFDDVPADATHVESIDTLVNRGFMIGKDARTFGTWDPMTRGQLATLLANAAGLPLNTPSSPPYPDVATDATHAPGIAALRDAGVVGNCGGGRFCADDPVKRDSTASFVDMVRSVRGDW